MLSPRLIVNECVSYRLPYTKYGIEMTGGVFLPQQVIQMMSHDSATWRVKLSNTETEEAVQAYLEALHMCRSKW